MGTDEAKHRILPRKIRLLAVAAGCLSGVAGCLGMGLLFWIYPSLLILGAVAQPRFPRSGRWLMYVGAPILSVWILPYGVGVVSDGVRNLPRYHDVNSLVVIILWAMSFSLVAWCDIALVIEAIKANRPRQRQET